MSTVSNFQIGLGASVPVLECTLTKDGRLGLYMQATPQGCPQETVNPDAVDLTDVWSMRFELIRPGRCPRVVPTVGNAQVLIDNNCADPITPKNGIVQYIWNPLDTACPGLYYGQFVINFKDGSILRWPFQMEALEIEVMEGPFNSQPHYRRVT